MDLFCHEKLKRLDIDSERFISSVRSLPEDSVRMIQETTWCSFGELHSRIVVFGFAGRLLEYICPSVVAYRIICRL